MAKNKLGRLIFRKIRGKLVPIKIKNLKSHKPDPYHWSPKKRYISAWDGDNMIGDMTLSIPKNSKTVSIESVQVSKGFRRRGIAKNLFKRATDFLSRSGYKFLRSGDLQHSAQAKIRSGYGRYKAGFKSKNRTKFFGDQFGAYGEHTQRIANKEISAWINVNPKGRLITATTMLKKYKYRKK